MTASVNRRDFLAVLAALGIQFPLGASAAATGVKLGDQVPFSFDALVEQARETAARPYAAPQTRAADVLETIDYDNHWKIKFRADHTLNLPGDKAPIRFFHLGRYFKDPVGINVVDGETARPVLYGPDYFDMPSDSPARQLPTDIGFAGFRVMEPGGVERDWLAFLGAAYFRTSGPLGQFGMSARAVAIDVALPKPEEFPRFTDFWFAPSSAGDITIYMLMDGPSITGALKMDCKRENGIVMDIAARYFVRNDIDRLGVGALTSMFWYGETSRRQARDWRPEIHDSDGLSIWTGGGERLWRPLNNPPQVMTSSFVDKDVRGFGLMQRDRNFENYQDDGVFYEKRASVWVEPVGAWGDGAVQLVEIPTDDEIHDNIVAYWVPAKPARAGDAVPLDYKVHWLIDEPYPAPIGRTYATRAGIGGVPGQPRPPGVVKFSVDFDGGDLGSFTAENGIEADVTASKGIVSGVYTLPVVGTKRWRAFFDFTASPNDASPVDMRLYLKREGVALTETWLYQYHPGALVP
ncbi:glucan biosynthesis protein [Methylobrevis albus]|uniref:Glucan biosynthesis protein D n=1 Tax=Methylobrevis albus TaxID=2793297 RepID=A0A931N126_9HYPH|nr:glucan biosynthesis protein D [Methylobrevis albus]MBH0239859.1 glucan biosynthesis protein D [Methylobrevis albus]